jgi:hypothetical protein
MFEIHLLDIISTHYTLLDIIHSTLFLSGGKGKSVKWNDGYDACAVFVSSDLDI